MSDSYICEYNKNEKILVTSKTVDYGGSCSFKKNTEIWEKNH